MSGCEVSRQFTTLLTATWDIMLTESFPLYQSRCAPQVYFTSQSKWSSMSETMYVLCCCFWYSVSNNPHTQLHPQHVKSLRLICSWPDLSCVTLDICDHIPITMIYELEKLASQSSRALKCTRTLKIASLTPRRDLTRLKGCTLCQAGTKCRCGSSTCVVVCVRTHRGCRTFFLGEY